jgi:hypothetical protein
MYGHHPQQHQQHHQQQHQYQQQYDPHMLSSYAAAPPPTTMAAALRSPHGRPPCMLLSWSIGGRAVVVQPLTHAPYDVINSTMGPGQLHLTALRQLPEQLLTWCPNSPELHQVAAAREHQRPLLTAGVGAGGSGGGGGGGAAGVKTPVGSPGGIGGTLGQWVGFGKGKAAAAAVNQADVIAADKVVSESAWGPANAAAAAAGGGFGGSGGTSGAGGVGLAGSVSATALLLESWPGPLTASSSKDKVVAWVKERSKRYWEEEPLAGPGANSSSDDSNSSNSGGGSNGGRKGATQRQQEALNSMWELLGLMARNQGHLKPQGAGKNGKPGGGGGLMLEDECSSGDAAGGGILAMIKGEAAAWGGPGGGSSSSSISGAPGAHELLAAIAPDAFVELRAAEVGGVGAGAGGVGSALLRPVPPEGELQETAVKMQRLLLEGRRREALQVALGGQLWAPALLLAHG